MGKQVGYFFLGISLLILVEVFAAIYSLIIHNLIGFQLIILVLLAYAEIVFVYNLIKYKSVSVAINKEIRFLIDLLILFGKFFKFLLTLSVQNFDLFLSVIKKVLQILKTVVKYPLQVSINTIRKLFVISFGRKQ